MITTGCVLIAQGVGDNLYHTKMNNKTDSSELMYFSLNVEVGEKKVNINSFCNCILINTKAILLD